MKKYIAYYRVSTKKQGLGLEAQQTIVNQYIKANGGVIVAEYSEKESGKETSHRAELQEAMNQCKADNCTLIVAKLDRLSRDVSDTFKMFKALSNNIVVCNQDVSDTLTLGIFASLAQKERELISKRTKEALAELKAKGKQLGNPNTIKGDKQANAILKSMADTSAKVRKEKADNLQANKQAWAVIKNMTGSLRDKAEELNNNGFTTPKGGQWTAIQVSRLIARYTD